MADWTGSFNIHRWWIASNSLKIDRMARVYVLEEFFPKTEVVWIIQHQTQRVDQIFKTMERWKFQWNFDFSSEILTETTNINNFQANEI